MKFKPSYIVIPFIVLVVHWIEQYLISGKLPLETLREFTAFFQKTEVLPFPLSTMIFFWMLGVFVAVFFIFFKAAPLLLFWNRFPRRERHFHVILGLFVLYGLFGVLYAYFLGTYAIANVTILFSIIFMQLVIGFVIAASLWVHHLRSAAILAVAYLLLLALGVYAMYYEVRPVSVASKEIIFIEE